MRKTKNYLIFISIILFGCKTSNNHVQNNTFNNNNSFDLPTVVIYKTKNDYYDKVPVILNDDGTKITSYPDITSIFYNGNLALPEKLHGGFLLDKRGINKNVAFLSITYNEYSKLKKTPLLDEMMEMIVDKNPLTEMYNCGHHYQYKNIVNDLNKIIDDNQINKFTKITLK